MTLADVVVCSGGLLVVQRGAERFPESSDSPDSPSLRVGPVGAVTPPDSPPLTARRSDNVVWRRHWPQDRRLVVEFVDVAFVEVDDTAGTVVFDRELLAEMEQHLLFDHILPLVLARNGRIVLHGGVVSRAGRGVVLVGSSGAGKSTLTAYLWQHGWTVGGDDGAVLSPGSDSNGVPTAEPTYATLRLSPASAHLLGLATDSSSPVVGKLRFSDCRLSDDGQGRFRQAPVGLRLVAIVEPQLDRGEAAFERLGGIEAHAELFGSTFHADFSRTMLPAVVDGLGAVVEATMVGRLRVPRGRDGLARAEALLRGLLDQDGTT